MAKKMTPEEIKEHMKNPNILLKVAGKPYICKCGANLFHHKDDWEIYHCNGCPRSFRAT